MECIKCGSKSGLEMFPLQWEGDGDAVGFVFVCAACNEDDLAIRWSIEDGREEQIESSVEIVVPDYVLEGIRSGSKKGQD